MASCFGCVQQRRFIDHFFGSGAQHFNDFYVFLILANEGGLEVPRCQILLGEKTFQLLCTPAPVRMGVQRP
eukprot:11660865-Prorocentrum_lima.AAC.1